MTRKSKITLKMANFPLFYSAFSEVTHPPSKSRGRPGLEDKKEDRRRTDAAQEPPLRGSSPRPQWGFAILLSRCSHHSLFALV